MPQQVKHQVLIAAVAALICFLNLGAAALWDEDEPWYASCSHAMAQRGDWVVPIYNGDIFFDKPPLMFWGMISGFNMFGVSEFGARFWSAVMGIATALATYHLGRRLFSPQVGLWAGLIVTSSIIFTVSARAATVDAALTFVTTMAMLAFALGGLGRQRRIASCDAPDRVPGENRAKPIETRDYLPGRWFTFVSVYAFLGVAVLAKGPVGMLLPAAVIGLFLMLMNHRRDVSRKEAAEPVTGWRARAIACLCPLTPTNFLRSLWQMRPLTLALVVLAVAAPWYVLVGIRTEGLWLEQFFAQYNLRPFLQPILGHQGPFWYYVPAILIGFFPWSAFMTPTFLVAVRRIRQRHPWNRGLVFLLCWLGVYFVFWSICSTKLPHYVLPAYPALALLTACFLRAWLADPACVGRGHMRNAGWTLVVVGVGITVAVPIVTAILMPGEYLLGLVGLTLLAGGGVFLYQLRHDRQRPTMVVFAVTSVVFLVGMFGFGALRVDRYQNAKPLIAAIRHHDTEQVPRLAAYRFLRKSWIYYAECPIPLFHETEPLEEFLGDSAPAFVFTNDEHEADLHARFPGQFEVLTRRPRFLHSGEVVVLTRRTDSPAARVAGTMSPSQARRE